MERVIGATKRRAACVSWPVSPHAGAADVAGATLPASLRWPLAYLLGKTLMDGREKKRLEIIKHKLQMLKQQLAGA
ncbi:MAG: hypothetical protein IAF94_26890, partial [Pirellulaceae bacterium]|nr:hypothetical protein [Pirellulaceae bacterium]